MAWTAASTGAHALAGCVTAIALALACARLHAEPATMSVSAAPSAATEMAFDLPALPLKDALARFDVQTSLSVFYPSELAAGRTSHPVRGMLSAHAALQRLLQGTGLTAQATAPDAFVLVKAAADPAEANGTSVMADAAGTRAYDGLVQTRIYQALCARPALALGDYRLALSVRVGESGRVRQARLLDTTGDKRRDAAIIETVQQVDLGASPDDADKPFVLLVRPVRCGVEEARAGACVRPCSRASAGQGER
jgi:hypothetical protein